LAPTQTLMLTPAQT